VLAQDDRVTRMVGAIALAAIAGAFAFFVFVYDRIELGSPTRIKVYLAHGAGLREKASLVVGGQPIGRIESVENVPHGTTDVLNGGVGIVATVAIDSDEVWKVRADAELFVASRGPLSDKYLEVAPGKRGAEPGPPIREGAELRAADPPSIDNVLQRIWTNTTIARAFLEDVGPELSAMRTQLLALGANLDGITASDPRLAALTLAVEVRGLFTEAARTYDVGLGGEAGFAHFRATISTARTTLAQARTAIDKLQPLAAQLRGDVSRIAGTVAAQDPSAKLDALLAQARIAIDKLDPLLAKVEEISGRIARGEGSLGRLMKDPEFPEDAKELGKVLKRHPWRIIGKPKD
jgi:phospholipid/cholesterol/gamma-HCH transport system substrate-binding protein